jgi:hypothetical protein
MKLTLSALADNGIWISDDRVNAFVSSATNSIGEIGYHGQQPVSRNSRMLVAPGGILRFMRSGPADTLLPIALNVIDWFPDRIIGEDDSGRLTITAQGSAIHTAFTNHSNDQCRFLVTFASDALFANVQGSREWDDPRIEGNLLHLRCRDVIVLDDWLKRTGPYAGDFLIPEHWRRRIFSRTCRSGLATYEDLREEFRNSRVKLNDATTNASLGGEGFSVSREGALFRFEAFVPREATVKFVVSFGDRKPATEPSYSPGEGLTIPAPQLLLNGYPAITRFFATVPGLVDSCLVRDIGMPRATPGAYYWIWAWDALVTAMEMPAWGERRGMADVVRFVNSHRDEGGAIPARWTRSGMPMDTPPRGSLDFLHTLVTLKYFSETGDRQPLLDAYPFLVDHLEKIVEDLDEKGRISNMGFYPDLPTRFGRSERSVVTMEMGATYVFCRLVETAARFVQDNNTETRSRDAGERIRRHFMENFWDETQGFFVDSVDPSAGTVNRSFPLFSLLFLQSPLGWDLIREKVSTIADFVARNHLTAEGTLLVPEWDRNHGSEDAMASWYPHWDVYMLKLFRRAGNPGAIVAWLNLVERLLDHIGYCPEFLRLEGFTRGVENPWKEHGAYSNLNCVTGWHRAMVEGVVGIEHDPGGITIVPLGLPLGEVRLRYYRHHGETWNVLVENVGPVLTTIEVDGAEIRGCLKIPAPITKNGIHNLRIRYGNRAPFVRFLELSNAVVLASDGDERSAEVRIMALGTIDIVCAAPARPSLCIDGNPTTVVWDERIKQAVAHLALPGEHVLFLEVNAQDSNM